MKDQLGPSIAQIAEALAENCPPAEIVVTIAAQRPIFDVGELVQLLDRAKELQAQAEELQRKAAILMDVVHEIVKATPELAPATFSEPEAPQRSP